MNIGDRERTQPTKQELEELLGMLVAANDDGQLVGLVFVLQDQAGNTMVDHRGGHDVTEVACRTVRQRIAKAIADRHPAIAQAITANNHPLPRLN